MLLCSLTGFIQSFFALPPREHFKNYLQPFLHVQDMVSHFISSTHLHSPAGNLQCCMHVILW